MTFCGKFFVSQYQKHRMGTVLCFRTFLLSENLLYKIAGGSIMIPRRKCFVAQCRKLFVGESFSVSLISGIVKLYA